MSTEGDAVMKKRLARLALPIIYSGPYSYSSAPVELLFAALKLGELNPEHLPTGKKYVQSTPVQFLIFFLYL